jgi:hypothetical protein
LRSASDLVGLKLSHVVGRGRIRRAIKKLRQSLDLADVIVLGLVAEVAVRHVLQHGAAQIADGLLELRGGHRGLLS